MTVANEDPGIGRVRSALRNALKKAGAKKPTVVVKHNHRDYMHALAVSDVFEGRSGRQRDDLVWPSLRRLPMDVSMRLTLLLLLTPQEYADLKAEDRLLIGS